MIWLLHIALAATALSSDGWTLQETQDPEPLQEPSLVPS